MVDLDWSTPSFSHYGRNPECEEGSAKKACQAQWPEKVAEESPLVMTKQSVGLNRPDLRIMDRVGFHQPDSMFLQYHFWQDKWNARGSFTFCLLVDVAHFSDGDGHVVSI